MLTVLCTTVVYDNFCTHTWADDCWFRLRFNFSVFFCFSFLIKASLFVVVLVFLFCFKSILCWLLWVWLLMPVSLFRMEQGLQCLQKEMATYRHCVFVAVLRQCPTLLNPVLWQSWMTAYPGCTLHCLLADQLSFLTCIREEEVVCQIRVISELAVVCHVWC